MWEYAAIGVLVTAAVLMVIRRLVKGVSGGSCSACDRCDQAQAPSCNDNHTAPGDETPSD